MKNTSVRKLALAAMLTAVAVVGSTLSFPVLGSRCAPVQHMVNILCAVLLGPWYGLGVAFAASLLRNLLGYALELLGNGLELLHGASLRLRGRSGGRRGRRLCRELHTGTDARLR